LSDYIHLTEVYLFPQENEKLAAKVSLVNAANAVCRRHFYLLNTVIIIIIIYVVSLLM